MVNLCELEVSMTYMVNLSPDELLAKTHTQQKKTNKPYQNNNNKAKQ